MRTLTGYHNASRNDSGLYSCMATNSHGSAQRAVTVQVDCESWHHRPCAGWGAGTRYLHEREGPSPT